MLSDGERVEVKARVVDRYGDAAQFNFGRHTAVTSRAFCLAWSDDQAGVVRLEQALMVRTEDLLARWGCTQPRYCARTTLGTLRTALAN